MFSPYRLLILDADGTTIDAFTAIERAFALHGMDIGDLSRFQRRHNLFNTWGASRNFRSILAARSAGAAAPGCSEP
jgi:phosphoglycolate phosphatase